MIGEGDLGDDLIVESSVQHCSTIQF